MVFTTAKLIRSLNIRKRGFKVTVTFVGTRTQQEEETIAGAVSWLLDVISSAEFKAVMERGNLDPELTEKLIVTQRVADDFLTIKDATLKIGFYKTWNPWSSVVAYTSSDKIIRFNRRKLNRQKNEIAGTIAHEYCHVIGYKHDFHKTKERDKSVPYVIGNIVSEWRSK